MSRPASEDYLRPIGWDAANNRPFLTLRLQYTSWQQFIALAFFNIEVKKDVKKSMKTSDRSVARKTSRNRVKLHKAIILLAAAERDRNNRWAVLKTGNLIPDRFDETTADGGRIRAQGNDVLVEEVDGSFQTLKNSNIDLLEWTDYAKTQPEYKDYAAFINENRTERKPTLDFNSAIIEQCITGRKQPHREANLLRKAVRDWRELHGGKSFATATRKDARDFIEFLRTEKRDEDGKLIRRKNKPGTVERVIAALRVAVNHELLENKIRTKFRENIFTDHNIQLDDDEDYDNKLPFEEHHIAKLKEIRSEFTDEEWLMLTFHNSTGVRPEGIWSISAEVTEEEKDKRGRLRKTRGFIISKDKDKKSGKRYGPRVLPFPQALLDAKKLDGTPLLPEKIDGPLFSDRLLDTFLSRIRRKLKKFDITPKGSKLHLYSGRHRAEARMKGKVDPEYRAAILGHSRKLDTTRRQKTTG